jgi:hypothetical protein
VLRGDSARFLDVSWHPDWAQLAAASGARSCPPAPTLARWRGGARDDRQAALCTLSGHPPPIPQSTPFGRHASGRT